MTTNPISGVIRPKVERHTLTNQPIGMTDG